MRVDYANPEVARRCHELRFAQQLLGHGAKKLFRCLEQLENAPNLEDFRGFGKLEQLKHDKHGQFSMRIDQLWRLIFQAVDDPPPQRADGSLDWNRVQEIEILEVSKHYG